MRDQKAIIINGRNLEEILKDHKHSIFRDCKDWENKRANLTNLAKNSPTSIGGEMNWYKKLKTKFFMS